MGPLQRAAWRGVGRHSLIRSALAPSYFDGHTPATLASTSIPAASWSGGWSRSFRSDGTGGRGMRGPGGGGQYGGRSGGGGKFRVGQDRGGRDVPMGKKKLAKLSYVGHFDDTFRAYEEELHLGSCLSKFEIPPEKLRVWRSQMQKLADEQDKALRSRDFSRRKPKSKPVLQWPHPVPEQYLNHFAVSYEAEALSNIHDRSYGSNVLLEIRDVRVPASSHHPSMTRLAKHRYHIICYTHADNIDAATRDRVVEWTKLSWPDAQCMFVDTRPQRPRAIQKKVATGAGSESEGGRDKEQEQGELEQEVGIFDKMYDAFVKTLDDKGGANCALTVGVANTGKSSVLISLLGNAKLRGLIGRQTKVVKASRTGKGKKTEKNKKEIGIEDKPGKTRELTEYLLRDTPRAFFLDVPGLTPPSFFFEERPEAWYAFGAANLLPLGRKQQDDPELMELFCEYILHAMNRDGNFGYVQKLNMDGPTAVLEEVLEKITAKYITRGKKLKNFMKFFNTGNFGPVILDDLSRPYEPFVYKDKHYKKDKKPVRGGFNDYEETRDVGSSKSDDDFGDDDFGDFNSGDSDDEDFSSGGRGGRSGFGGGGGGGGGYGRGRNRSYGK